MLVADTSALVSLVATPDARKRTLAPVLDGYDVAVPIQVRDELEEIAQYDDDHAHAARAVLEPIDDQLITTHDVDLDPDFPLDDGENAGVRLANALNAAFFYCDEFTHLALIHASLSNPKLVTTPRLLHALVLHGELTNEDANALLEDISGARSWANNAYVHQARRLFE